ncbi:MAG: hypothetical protein HRT57_10300 [Crocinitomicaceae bacterium]|nr:hypothetical protein [Crocinitomicaceae bacterium]
MKRLIFTLVLLISFNGGAQIEEDTIKRILIAEPDTFLTGIDFSLYNSSYMMEANDSSWHAPYLDH